MSHHTSQAKLRIWKDHFEQFRQSEQTIKQFCRALGCGRSSFHYWQRKFGPIITVRQRQGWLGLIAEAIAGSLHPDDLAAVP